MTDVTSMRKRKKGETGFILLLCALYVVFMISRTDFSAVLLDMIQELGLRKESLSIAITVNYICYTAGMLINSLVANQRNSRFLICASLLGAAATHFGIRAFPSLPVIILLWGGNGYLQSMMWPSVLCEVNRTIPLERRISTISIISMSQQAGGLACYLLVPGLLPYGGWKLVVLVVAVGCMVGGLVWTLVRFCVPATVNADIRQVQPHKLDGRFFKETNMALFFVIGVITGMLREGVTTWAPVYYTESFSTTTSTSILLTALLQVSRVLAYIVYPGISKKVKDLKKLMLLILGISLLAVFTLFFADRAGAAWLAVALMAVLLTMVSCIGITCAITLPVRLSSTGRTATISGFLDASIYVGAAISAYLFAAISTRKGWGGVICTWGILILVCIGMLIAQQTIVPDKKQK